MSQQNCFVPNPLCICNDLHKHHKFTVQEFHNILCSRVHILKLVNDQEKV